MTEEVLEKRLDWALRQCLSDYKGIKLSDETRGRIMHEIANTVERVLKTKEAKQDK